MNIRMAESICRTLLGVDVSRMSTAEIRRDLLVYARQHPQDLLNALDDPGLQIKDIAAQALREGLIQFRNQKRDVYFSLPKNKKTHDDHSF